MRLLFSFMAMGSIAIFVVPLPPSAVGAASDEGSSPVKLAMGSCIMLLLLASCCFVGTVVDGLTTM
jgi:hypothetical protein